jgi:histidinol-phosphatase (PHP family)
MPFLQNLHTHTRFSDGSDVPVKYVEAAIAQNMNALGFSDHSPLPFENTFALRENQVDEYCEAIRTLQARYPEVSGEQSGAEFRIFLGMEADFIPGMGHSFRSLLDHNALDYLIGSVHLVRNGSPEDLWFIDGPDPATYDEGLNRFFGGDIRKGVTAYYHQINEMLLNNPMDIVGHLDKIKMHNRGRFFLETDSWYLALVDETLDLIKQTNRIVEVNTRGIYKKRSDSLFPGPDILKKIHALDIPVIITSDAHKPHEISMLFSETAELLSGTGFREVLNLTAEGWKKASLL